MESFIVILKVDLNTVKIMGRSYKQKGMFHSLSISSSSSDSSPKTLQKATSELTVSSLNLQSGQQSLEEWGLHGVQIVMAMYAVAWREEMFLFLASFILSLYEVTQTHDAGRLTLWRNYGIGLLWGLKTSIMGSNKIFVLVAISLALAIINIWSRREEEKRSAKKTERENVLLLAPDGVVIVEKGGKAVRCNAQALEMMKAGSEAELLTLLENYTSEGSILSRATSDSPNPFYTSHSGRSFEWRFQISSERTFLFIRDISPLDSLKASIAASNSFTQSLLADFLKKLRSPLNTIVNLSEEMRDSEGFAIRVCKSAAQTLASVMSDLRDIEHIKSGAFELKKCRFELDKLLSECVDVIAPQAALKHISFAQRYDCTIPKRIRSDPNRIRQVVLTLLNDAIKFNSSGYLELVAVSTRDNTVKVSIEDPDSRSKDPGEYIDIRLAVAKNISKRLSSSGLRVEDSSAEGFKSSFEIDISLKSDSETDSDVETEEGVSSDDSDTRIIPAISASGTKMVERGTNLKLGEIPTDSDTFCPHMPEHSRLLKRCLRLSFNPYNLFV